MAKLILLIGPPASGKSNWREKYLSSAVEQYTIISSDDLVDKWAAEHGVTYNVAIKNGPSFDKTVKYAFRDAVKRGENIIVDRTNMSAKSRRTWTASLTSDYETHAVVFVVDDITLKQRMADRFAKTGKSVPDFVVKAMNNRYEAPSKDEGFATITYVK